MSHDYTPNQDSATLPDTRKRTVALLRDLAPTEGYNLTALPSVRILRSDRAL